MPGRRHARRRAGPGDGRTFSPTSRLGAGGGGERRRLRAPGPNAAWPGSAASARGAAPGRYLPSSRAGMGRCCCGSGWRGGIGVGGEARRALSLLPPPRPGRLAQRRLHSRPWTRYFRGREFPGAPTPRPRSPPPLCAAPALAPGSAPPPGAGLRLPARAAGPLTGTDAAPTRAAAPPRSGPPRLPVPARAARSCGPPLPLSP